MGEREFVRDAERLSGAAMTQRPTNGVDRASSCRSRIAAAGSRPRSGFRVAASSLLVAGLLAGCTTAKNDTPTRSLLSARPAPSTPYITALQGGIVSRSGVTISSSDRARALEAEYRALEAAPGGQPVAWKGSDVSGQVVANAPYQVGTQNCRQYRHTVTANGKEATARGAACRNSDGTWTPLS